MIKLDYDDFIQRIAPAARAAIERWWQSPGTSGLVYFENRDPGHRGEASVLAVGPERMVKSPRDAEGTHLNELPELRQYPLFYCEKKAG